MEVMIIMTVPGIMHEICMQCFQRERWNGGVLKAPFMQERCGQISPWRLPFPPRPLIRNAPR